MKLHLKVLHEFSVRKKKASPVRPVSLLIKAALRGKVTKAVLVQERHNRDERKREEKRKQIQQYTPVSVRRFRG